MTQEDKDLLLKDLCSRLPYRTMVKCNTDGRHEFDEELSEMHIMNFYQFDTKPYLRPMSSMTEEEIVELKWLNEKCDAMPTFEYVPIENYRIYDWMNRHHFDYRGLIEKGLALEAPEGMYNI